MAPAVVGTASPADRAAAQAIQIGGRPLTPRCTKAIGIPEE